MGGPQDTCGDDGLQWFAAPAPEHRRVIACYADDEGGKPAIEKNLAFFSEVHTFTASGKPRNYGAGSWCASPAHCSSAVDDQLVEDVVEQCLPKLTALKTALTTVEPTSGAIFFAATTGWIATALTLVVNRI